jgi:phenylacetic acid degradation operon negative regulatory protein
MLCQLKVAGKGENVVQNARTRQGSPPSILLTLLGDYWWRRPEPLPSAALVELLGDFGVTTQAARAALSRLASRGLVEQSRSGRRTGYALTRAGADVLDDGARRIFGFGVREEQWDGAWHILGITVGAALRASVHHRLRWLGFAPLNDGLWVSPWGRLEEAVAMLADRGVREVSAFRGTALPSGPGLRPPESAWSLEELADRYVAFTAQAETALGQTLAGEVAPSRALVLRTELMDSWRVFPALDPELPRELLPGRWPGGRARLAFLDAYTALGRTARLRVREVVDRHDPELARLVTDRKDDHPRSRG